jgi:hypothetical protein
MEGVNDTKILNQPVRYINFKDFKYRNSWVVHLKMNIYLFFET